MHFLVTRPLADSQMLATKLEAEGHTVTTDPLMTVQYLSPEIENLNQYQALIFTSPNAVNASKELIKNLATPAYCVGNKTADVAKKVGLKNVISSHGDVKALALTIKSALVPAEGPLLYMSGSHLAGDIKTELETADFSVTRKEIYETKASDSLSNLTINMLKNNKIDYIPFYSPRSVLIFIELVKNAGYLDCLKGITVLCLSPAIEDALSGTKWNKIITATKPSQYDLFNMIDIDL